MISHIHGYRPILIFPEVALFKKGSLFFFDRDRVFWHPPLAFPVPEVNFRCPVMLDKIEANSIT